MPPTQATVIVVLGMHRSGTSCLAGCLEQAGLHLGQVNTKAPFNARGNRENRSIMDLHDDVLRASGGAWDRPPAAVQWDSLQRQRRDAIIAGYPSDDCWGFKEPRTLLTFDGWLEVLPAPRCVGTFRHPTATVESLRRRNGLPSEQGYALWLAYNQRLLQYQERLRFPPISFDWNNQHYAARVTATAQALGLPTPDSACRFFEADLRRNRPQPQLALPDEVTTLYNRLLEIAA